MDLCKHLQCEHSVVHSGKSLSLAAVAPISQRANDGSLRGRRENALILLVDSECLRQAAGDPRGSHSTRPGSEMERMGRGRSGLP